MPEHQRLDQLRCPAIVLGQRVTDFGALNEPDVTWCLSTLCRRATTADELNERNQLEALRELLTERRLLHRMEVTAQFETEAPAVDSATRSADGDTTNLRIEEARRRISQLEIYLGSAGWGVAHLESD